MLIWSRLVYRPEILLTIWSRFMLLAETRVVNWPARQGASSLIIFISRHQSCVFSDVTLPSFTNCPGSPVDVQRYSSGGSLTLPTATDNSNVLKELTVTPNPPELDFYYTVGTVNYLYMAKDFADNTYSCALTVNVLGEIFFVELDLFHVKAKTYLIIYLLHLNSVNLVHKFYQTCIVISLLNLKTIKVFTQIFKILVKNRMNVAPRNNKSPHFHLVWTSEYCNKCHFPTGYNLR